MSDPDTAVRITKKEFEALKSENARYREALKIVAEGEAHLLRYYQLRDLAREALRGDITPEKGGE